VLWVTLDDLATLEPMDRSMRLRIGHYLEGRPQLYRG
jgi:hypothetical protein